MNMIKCIKCEYEWESRVQEPKACPRCKTRLDYIKLFLEKSLSKKTKEKLEEN